MFGEIVAKPIEAAFPARAARGDPLPGPAQRYRLDVAGAHPPDLPRSHQAACLQDLEVLHDRGKGHVERLGEFANRRRAAAKAFDDVAAGGIRQGVEQQIEGDRIVKHMLKYLP
jgi:hypothetical protein